MHIWKASLIVLVLVGVALFAGCESTASTPLAPDVQGAPSAATVAASQDPVLTTSTQYGRGNGALGTIYVTSQDLYYDTFVTAEKLPPKGRFQLLEDGETEYGPGDPGYLGGRWKVANGMGGFDYFLCPLLPPGRENP